MCDVLSNDRTTSFRVGPKSKKTPMHLRFCPTFRYHKCFQSIEISVNWRNRKTVLVLEIFSTHRSRPYGDVTFTSDVIMLAVPKRTANNTQIIFHDLCLNSCIFTQNLYFRICQFKKNTLRYNWGATDITGVLIYPNSINRQDIMKHHTLDMIITAVRVTLHICNVSIDVKWN